MAALSDSAMAPRLDLSGYVRARDDGGQELDLLVEGMHCGGCVAKIERSLKPLPGVTEARANLTTRRLHLAWQGARDEGAELARRVEELGFTVVPFEPARLDAGDRQGEKELLRALGVAGFAAANVMLLSISVWAGAGEAGTATRELFHWFSALIALPAIAYAGRPFFRSALRALSHGRTNMDVPISLGVILAAGMSLLETATGGQHVYFESAVMLLFFLLVGRYLDRRARSKARGAAERLLALGATAVTVLRGDGSRALRAPEEVEEGAKVLVAAGERIAVDGGVCEGRSEVDASLITGESLPSAVAPGAKVFAGTLNIGGPLTLTVTATGQRTLLAEIARLMEVAEQRRARYVGLADRAARLYAPVVHSLALLTFLGWWGLGGLAWQPALLIAISVLIITCPCALGLAVPAVQVVASNRLLRAGILLKSPTALERLAAVDHVVFDKTGTLTEGRPELIPQAGREDALRQAVALAAVSTHPLSRALVRAAPEVAPAADVRELPGRGLALDTPEGEIRLGSAAWCGVESEVAREGPELWLTRPGEPAVRFAFEDRPREDAREVIAALRAQGLSVELLSGDRPETAGVIAAELGIEAWQGSCTPEGKVARLEALAADGRSVLMVGDGLNDAPALAAAAVSLSPASAADISQTAADAVFQGAALKPVIELLAVARGADALVKQNFALAALYNVVAIPVAMAGFVTPLIAAAAMSGSSLAVIGNALRLSRKKGVARGLT